MKVALVHDYLTQDGGAERVLRVLQELFPDAPTFVLFHHPSIPTLLMPEKDIRTTFLHYLPFIKHHYQWYLPLMPFATERHDIQDFDVVISSTSAFAKGIITPPTTLHISYCHTPTRYLWTDTHNYIKELNYPWIVKMALPSIISRLRLWDQMSAQRVDHFIANSDTVKERIQKFYRRDARVIYPPIALNAYAPAPQPEDYFLTGGRLVSYKRFDLVVQAFNRLGLPLKIFGAGPEETTLRAHALPNIEFVGRVDDETLKNLYRGALAFINPQVEDFGLTAVESMASGRPVIAYAEGGALETVKDTVSGVFFHEQSWESLLDAVLDFDHTRFTPEEVRASVEKFDVSQFKKQLQNTVTSLIEDYKKGVRQTHFNI
ncbi:MAG: glycosyltransferase [Candidatus Magasanikbacteria bacterium]|nr:glycosyltransferase [Candidatus Magasanikbacteria bacterium]